MLVSTTPAARVNPFLSKRKISITAKTQSVPGIEKEKGTAFQYKSVIDE